VKKEALEKFWRHEIEQAKATQQHRTVRVRNVERKILGEALNRVYTDKALMDGIRKIRAVDGLAYVVEVDKCECPLVCNKHPHAWRRR